MNKMKYSFKLNDDWIIIEVEGENDTLTNFSNSGWTPQKVQEIIDKVEGNLNLKNTEDPYVWGNEDVVVFANEIGVLLIDNMAIRAKQQVNPSELSHNEFILFLQDFKKFVEENS